MKIPSVNKQKDFWDDWVFRSYAWERNPDNQRRLHYILREVTENLKPNLKILDIGCGSGWLCLELQKYGKVTGIDLSSKAITELKSNYKNIQWLAGDFCTLEFPSNYFDVVTCLETIAHVPDQKRFAAKIEKVIKLEGLLLLTTQNEYIWNRTSWLKPPGEGQIRNWPSRKHLLELFSTGFTINRIRTCAPGGDRGLPKFFTNRISRSIGSLIFGSTNWVRLLESMGFGRSLFLVAKRSTIENK